MRLLPDIPQHLPWRGRQVSRRQVLRWGLLGTTAALLPVALPGCGDDEEPPSGTAPEAPQFLDTQERTALRALVDTILPPVDTPGAVAMGAHTYIERLLSAVPDDNNPGLVFAGGPFSGRNPYPDYDRGAPSSRFPPNEFTRFLPLTRLQLLGWRARLLGSQAVPEFDFNASVLGPVVGLRTQYRQGLRELDELAQSRFGSPFAALSLGDREHVLAQANPEFVSLVTDHVLEGIFSAPEYGGNRDQLGWQFIGYDGDSQPLGYALYDRSAGIYRERVDKPTSGPEPGEKMEPFPSEVDALLRLLVRLIGEPRFP